MTLKTFHDHFSNELTSIFPKTEVDTFFAYLIEEYLGLQRIDLIMNPDREISDQEQESLDIALQRLKKEEPIQYIIGKTEFYGFPFYVDKNVLIPRPETEELVEWVIKEVKEKGEKVKILDIGTGSGCIPISLKKHLPNAEISAIDISKKAIEVAKKNAELNQAEISFIELDILQVNNLNSVIANEMKQSHEITSSSQNLGIPRNDIKFDIIISNPPYVRELEKAEMKNNVLENEPELALFVDDTDPLIFYDTIAGIAKQHLTKGGLLFFEINQYLGKEMLALLHDYQFQNIELKKDLFGKDRMTKATF
ncbi:peptide chain release factor N(5)-glutamine methyltransferase [Pseudotenacibaculum haliotis]|uniref:Release factor glutamine methyltransferase n=1 Tax=Pseudotenacibaculum haliotis TaxID=1862138 RepID=A0ABW5LPD8_9FLAO